MAIKNITSRVQQRIDTAANWSAENPVLLNGELGIESDTRLIKVGDGTSNWNDLLYVNNFGFTSNGSAAASTQSEITALQNSGAAFIIDTTTTT